MMSNESPGSKKIAAPMLAGLLYGFITMIIAALLISFILIMSDQKDSTLTMYTYIIHALSLAIGGISAGRVATAKGWYTGGVTGLLYALIIQGVAFLAFDKGLSLQTMVQLVGAFSVAALGGMIGVNTKSGYR